MKYKFIDEDNVKVYKKGFVILNSKIITNPSDKVLAEVGYKDKVVLEEPEYDMETQYPKPKYRDDGDVITQYWEIKEIEEEIIEE